MYLSVHATAGVLIGSYIVHPPTALVLGVLSHFLLDMLPHSDGDIPTSTSTAREVRRRYLDKIISIIFLDLCATIVVAAAFFTNNLHFITPAVSWAVIGSILPDLIQIVAYLLPRNRALHHFQAFHNFLHYNPKKPISMVTGHLTQAATLVLLITPVV